MRVDVPVGHADFGKPMVCRCVDQGAAQAEWVRRQLPGALRGKTFGSFKPGFPVDGEPASTNMMTMRIAGLEAAKRWAAEGGWLFLQGKYGAGKSHLAAAAVEVLAQRGETVIWGMVPDILDELRNHIGEDAFLPFYEGLKAAPWLVLDDLGSERLTEWVVEKMEQLLDYRTREQLPTMITSNLRIDQLPGRMASRIKRQAVGVVMA